MDFDNYNDTEDGDFDDFMMAEMDMMMVSESTHSYAVTVPYSTTDGGESFVTESTTPSDDDMTTITLNDSTNVLTEIDTTENPGEEGESTTTGFEQNTEVVDSGVIEEKPECTKQNDCPGNLRCMTGRCTDPCSGTDCPGNAVCRVKFHTALCLCPDGFSGSNCSKPKGISLLSFSVLYFSLLA